TGGAVRLLHQRHDHGREGAARAYAEADGRSDQTGARRQPLSMRDAHAHRARDSTRFTGVAMERTEATCPERGTGYEPSRGLSRRDLLKAGGAIVVSFAFPLAARGAFAQTSPGPGPRPRGAGG